MAGLVLTVPTMALPRVIAAGGFWIATLTRTVELLRSTDGETSLTLPTAVTCGSETRESNTRLPSTSSKSIDSGISKAASRSPSWASVKTVWAPCTTCPISRLRAVITPAARAWSSVSPSASRAVPSCDLADSSVLSAVCRSCIALSYVTRVVKPLDIREFCRSNVALATRSCESAAATAAVAASSSACCSAGSRRASICPAST
ncbi:MAG: hypothetical protein QOI40_2617 [Alphaproteobacteria bacterium]|nr:hypothetical protein [Alphaproteobacteria bacterium]